MTSESQQEPVGSPSVRVLVPSYLLYFVILPIIATFVLSAIDPMAGMALLTCFLVMALVLRFFTRVESFDASTSCQTMHSTTWWKGPQRP